MNISRTRRRLLAWYARAARDLPWRRTRDPYRIWVSEIMLQQTRVAAVLPYYERFLERFPDVESLARAGEDEILAAWSGLGYYSRARNLRKAARRIVELGGFPQDYESIRGLPGAGDYTAAAVASIAFDLPHAVVDGNVLRVLSRLMNDAGDISALPARRRIGEHANRLLDRKCPGQFNQAMMEVGATICLPREPKCLLCPLAECCEARRLGIQTQLPVKLRRAAPVRIDKTLLVIERRGKLAFWQRCDGARRGFWELPEADQLPRARIGRQLGSFRHSITHHTYRVAVVEASASQIPREFSWMPPNHLKQIRLSTTAKKALAFFHL
jgi:A/G-specific adenine glycosylase